MNCPSCKETTLMMSERHGIEIDYCPKCRGVWLDRGELDKIIAEATADDGPEPQTQQPQQPPAAQQQPYYQQTPPYPPQAYGNPYPYGKYGYKKKKEWWKEVFDF